MSRPGDDDSAHDPDRSSGSDRVSDLRSETSPPGEGRRSDPPSRHGGPDGGNPDEFTLFLRDVATSVLAVVLLGGYIFMISGVWPPMVAIESGSMEPNMEVNDLVFVMETGRFQPPDAHGETGVVTAREGRTTGYSTYGGDGDVIVFEPQGNDRVTPVIHRAMFWVEEGENWCEKADDDYLTNREQCRDASHAGFVTKGDNNNQYDQTNQQFEPVKPEWVVGTAEVRVPGLGWLRLRFQ